MKLLVPWLRKSGFWGHSRSPDPKFGVFVVTQGQNMKIFEPALLYTKMKLFGFLGILSLIRHSYPNPNNLEIDSIHNPKIFKNQSQNSEKLIAIPKILDWE